MLLLPKDDEVPRVTDGSNDDGIIAQASIVSVDVLREIGKRCKSTVLTLFLYAILFLPKYLDTHLLSFLCEGGI